MRVKYVDASLFGVKRGYPHDANYSGAHLQWIAAKAPPCRSTLHVHLSFLVHGGRSGGHGGGFRGYVAAENDRYRQRVQRLRSLQLADEMRRSSDDLTRLAALSVMTGDDLYQRHYEACWTSAKGANRDRPVIGSPRSTWPQPLTCRCPRAWGWFCDRMRSAGFIDQGPAGPGQGVVGQPDPHRARSHATEPGAGQRCRGSHARARAMLHDAAYLSAKAAIMAPIEGFHTQVMERTQAAVAQAERNALALRVVFMGLGLLLMFMLYRTSRALRTVLGGRWMRSMPRSPAWARAISVRRWRWPKANLAV